MIQVRRVKMYGVLLAAGVLCVSLMTGAQVYAAGKGYPAAFKGDGGPAQLCDGCGPHQGMGCGMWGDGAQGKRMWQALKQLDLTDAQQAAIHDIGLALKKDEIKKGADLRIASVELRDFLSKDSVDMSTVEAQIKKIEGFKTAMMLKAIKSREEIKSKLTPEQMKKFNELM